MDYYSVLTKNERYNDILQRSKLNLRKSWGTFGGVAQDCWIVIYEGFHHMERVRTELNQLAHNNGEKAVLHVANGIATLEYADGSWDISSQYLSGFGLENDFYVDPFTQDKISWVNFK